MDQGGAMSSGKRKKKQINIRTSEMEVEEKGRRET